MKTHLIIDPSIQQFQNLKHPGHTIFGNFRRISYKDKIDFETTRMAVRKFSGKRHFSYYPCMHKTLNYES